jgi:hypothetical protein
LDQDIVCKIRDSKVRLASLKKFTIELAPIPCLPKDFFISQIFNSMNHEALLVILETLNFQAIAPNYFTVFVVHTGHFQKIQSRKVFKSGTPSELSYIS